MKRNKENKRPWPYRFISVVLACAMLFTSSGFQTLAQEASTEIQTESAEEIAARQAAQQAQEALLKANWDIRRAVETLGGSAH